MIVQDALREGAAKLQAVGVSGAANDARILLTHAMGIDASRIAFVSQDEISADVYDAFQTYISAREHFQPVSQIIGGREFWGRWFKVTPDVLDPRPDTETLIEIALASGPFDHVLDLGTGSGILAVTLAAEWPDASMVATDISSSALEVAAKNAGDLDVAGQVTFRKSNWFEDVSGKFDLIVSNPPYITELEMADLSTDVRDWEPHLALTPGGDGLAAYRIIAQKLDQFLTTDGLALFEIGHLQGDDVLRIFSNAGFENVTVSKDLSGHDRIVSVRR